MQSIKRDSFHLNWMKKKMNWLLAMGVALKLSNEKIKMKAHGDLAIVEF